MSEFLSILHWAIMIVFGACVVWIAFGRPHPIARLYVGVILLLQVLYNGCILTAVQNHFWVQQGLQPTEINFIAARISDDPIWLLLGRTLFLGAGLWQIKLAIDQISGGVRRNAKKA